MLCLLSAASVVAGSPGHALPDSPRADAVVGTGTPASCTETDFDTAVSTVQASGGGTITFNCGGPHTIVFSSVRTITSQVVVKGGDVITLSGGDTTRLFSVAFGARLELRNITLSNGYAASGDGGAVFNDQGVLHLEHARFLNNSTSAEGGSGGAIASTRGPVTAINSLFENNSAANGGAVYLLFGDAVGTFTDTTFKDNRTLSEFSGLGGAIRLWIGASLTVRGCDFDGNSARNGGAIHNQFANVTVRIERGTLVRRNTADAGGGLWLAGTTIIDESVIVGNRGEATGGGIYHQGGTLTIRDSTIAENETMNGAGLRLHNGFTTLTRSTLVGNSADGNGGGIFLVSSVNARLSVENSTLSGNSAFFGGGAISTHTDSGSLEIDLRHVTITDNVAHLAGRSGGLWVRPDFPAVDAVVTLTLTNTALSGNSSPTCSIAGSIATAATARYSLWSDMSCSFGTAEANHPNTQAFLGPLVDNGGPTLTHAPLEGSPLINNGTCLSGVATDQRGAQRLHGLACDIGSVEAGADFDGTIFADRFQSTPPDFLNQHAQ